VIRVIATGMVVGLATAACITAIHAAPPPVASPAIPVADGDRPPYTAADAQFMTGMIRHHAQAVLIAGWAPSHGASASVRILCERIVVGQRDEIAVMQRWLSERHEPVPPADMPGHAMPGMDQSPLMPGMLAAEQLAKLDGARGKEFDQLFLTFMIQHHRGAITMVEQLLHTQGAAQDGQVFRFANDVFADQTTEIDRMQRMLDRL